MQLMNVLGVELEESAPSSVSPLRVKTSSLLYKNGHYFLVKKLMTHNQI